MHRNLDKLNKNMRVKSNLIIYNRIYQIIIV